MESRPTESHVSFNRLTISGRLRKHPVVFTPDSKYMFSAFGLFVKVFNVDTGMCVQTLGGSKIITGIALHPTNPVQLLVTSNDGCLKSYDYMMGKELLTIKLNRPIAHLAVSFEKSSAIYAACHATQNDTKISEIYHINLETRKSVLVYETKSRCEQFKISKNGEFLYIGEQHELCILSTKNHTMVKKMNFGDLLTSLDVHPTQNYIAAGFRSGKIQIYYNVLISNEKPIQTKLHWHASTVSALKFTEDGAYLLSGGEESVLVMWQLGSKDRTYLPRLQSEITSITVSPDHLHYAMTHLDNTIRLVSTSNYAVTEIVVGLMGINTCHQFPMYVGLQVNPRTGHVLMNGSPASLQLIDPSTDRHISEMEVTPMNKVSKSHSQQYASRIKHAAFSKDGLWMATVDVRRTEDISEAYIKFWQFDQDSQTFMVNTRIYNPHDSDLTCLQFGEIDSKLICVTCGKDSKFKLWQLNAPTVEVEEPHWTGRSSVNCAAGIPKSACFNEDGSLIAVAIESSVTLWNSITNAMVGNLDYYSLKEKINYVSFLTGTPYLIAASDHYVHVWNLLSCQVVWVLKTQVKGVKTDPLSSQFVVMGPNSLTIYDSSFQPLYTKRLPYDALMATFLTKKSQLNAPFDHQILIMTTQFDLFILGSSVDDELEQPTLNQAEEKEGLFTGIYGKSSKSKNKVEALNKVRQAFPFLDLPSHSMPMPTTLIEPFFSAILKPKLNNAVAPPSQDLVIETQLMSLDTKYHPLNVSEMTQMISQIVIQ